MISGLHANRVRVIDVPGALHHGNPNSLFFLGAAFKSFPFIAANGNHINFLRNAQAFDLQIILFCKR